MRPSSTSSSESGRGRSVLLWAGLAAVLLVLAFNRWALDAPVLVAEPGALPRVVVLGSGRVERAFLPGELNAALAGQATVRAHGGSSPGDMAALGELLAEQAAAVVVLGLSEFEIYQPLESAASEAGSSEGSLVTKLAGGRTERELAALVTRVGMTFPDLLEATRRDELIQLLSLSRGEHVSSRQSPLRAAVERLTAAGASVILVELPLHPLAHQYYDVTLREEALSFFAELAVDLGVTVVTEEMSGPFAKSDFASLTQVTEAGAVKLCHSAAGAILKVLQGRQVGAER